VVHGLATLVGVLNSNSAQTQTMAESEGFNAFGCCLNDALIAEVSKTLRPYSEGNLHKIGKQMTNKEEVVGKLGQKFEDLDLIVKAFVCRCLLRDQFPSEGNQVIFAALLQFLTVDKKIVTHDWMTLYYAMKISHKRDALTGKKRIEKFIRNEQTVFLHKLAKLFYYKSRSFTLRCLDNFDNGGPAKEPLFQRKIEAPLIFGISGWFFTDLLTNNTIVFNIFAGKMENSRLL